MENNPQIIVEPLLRDRINILSEEIQWYCFKGEPKLCIRIETGEDNQTTMYDNNLNIIRDTLTIGDIELNRVSDDLIKQTYVLSKKLAKNFIFVRIDFMVYQNKVYFEELTFTPYSGFKRFIKPRWNKYMGKLLKI